MKCKIGDTVIFKPYEEQLKLIGEDEEIHGLSMIKDWVRRVAGKKAKIIYVNEDDGTFKIEGSSLWFDASQIVRHENLIFMTYKEGKNHREKS